MKNLIILVSVITFSFNLSAQNQKLNAMDKVKQGAFWTNNLVGQIGKQIHFGIRQDGVYNISTQYGAAQVAADFIEDGNTHIAFKDKNYTSASKNYLNAEGGVIWWFIENPSVKRFAKCNNIIHHIKTFEKEIVYVPGTNNTIVKQPIYTNTSNDRVVVQKTVAEQRNENVSYQPVMDDCENARFQAQQILMNYQDGTMFGSRKAAQDRMNALSAQFPCLGFVHVQKAHKGARFAENNAIGIFHAIVSIKNGRDIRRLRRSISSQQTTRTETWGPNDSGNQPWQPNTPGNGSGSEVWGGKSSTYKKAKNSVNTSFASGFRNF